MTYIPIKIDRTNKPPICTPLRSDGHWSVQGLIGAWALNEYSGTTANNLVPQNSASIGACSTGNWAADGYNLVNENKISIPNLDPYKLPPSPGYSFLFCGDVRSIQQYDVAFGLVDYTGYGWRLWTGDVTNFRWYASFRGINNVDCNAIGPLMEGGNQTVIGTVRPTEVEIVTNGIASTTAITSTGAYYGTTPYMTIGSMFSSGVYARFLDGVAKLCLVFARPLTKAESLLLSANPWQVFEPETVWISVNDSSIVNQHSFRFINDDGNESSSTFAASINSNLHLLPGDIKRIRLLIDASGDPIAEQFQLEYRHKFSGGSFSDWTKVK